MKRLFIGNNAWKFYILVPALAIDNFILSICWSRFKRKWGIRTDFSVLGPALRWNRNKMSFLICVVIQHLFCVSIVSITCCFPMTRTVFASFEIKISTNYVQNVNFQRALSELHVSLAIVWWLPRWWNTVYFVTFSKPAFIMHNNKKRNSEGTSIKHECTPHWWIYQLLNENKNFFFFACPDSSRALH